MLRKIWSAHPFALSGHPMITAFEAPNDGEETKKCVKDRLVYRVRRVLSILKGSNLISSGGSMHQPNRSLLLLLLSLLWLSQNPAEAGKSAHQLIPRCPCRPTRADTSGGLPFWLGRQRNTCRCHIGFAWRDLQRLSLRLFSV